MSLFVNIDRLVNARESSRVRAFQSCRENTERRLELLDEAVKHRAAVEHSRRSLLTARDLDREGLFDRLRSVATAHAHAIETELHAAALETAAAALLPVIEEHRLAARLYGIKAEKLRRWRSAAAMRAACLKEKKMERSIEEDRSWPKQSIE